MLSKQEIESRTIELLISWLNPLSYQLEKRERPDFLLSIDGEEIACEVTEFDLGYGPKGSKIREREIFLKTLHSEVRKELIRLYPKGYCFDICYDSEPSKASNSERTIRQLIEALSKPEKDQRLPKDVQRVSIRKTETGKRTIIIFSQYTNPKPDISSTIHKIVENKSRSKNKWPSRFEKNWLVLTAGVTFASSIFDSQLEDLHVASESWEKIFLTDITTGKAWQLK